MKSQSLLWMLVVLLVSTSCRALLFGSSSKLMLRKKNLVGSRVCIMHGVSRPAPSQPTKATNAVVSTKELLMKRIPNVLTLSRIYTVPVFMISYLLGLVRSWLVHIKKSSKSNMTIYLLTIQKAAACSLYALSCLTDFLDGYLARKWNQTSAFGAFLDPVADKVRI